MASLRNAPCPCGSGKKTKRCCGTDAAARLEPTDAERIRAADVLERFANEPRHREHVRRGRELLWARWEDRLEPLVRERMHAHDTVANALFGLAVLDLPIAGDGRTIAERVLAERGARLPSAERAAVEQLAGATLELMRVDLDGARRILVRRDGTRIRDAALPEWLLPGDALGARVVGSPPAIAPLEILDLPRVLTQGQTDELPPIGVSNGTALFDLWISSHLGTILRVQRKRGLPLGSHEMSFLVRDAAGLHAALRDGPLDARQHDDATWTWAAQEDAEGGVLLLDGEELLATSRTRRGVHGLRNLLGALGVEHAGTRATTSRRERPSVAYPYLHADLGHYLDGGDLSIRVAKEARRLGLYLGRITAEVSRAAERGPMELDLPCRRRPDGRPCPGPIRARIDDGGRVLWECAWCGDAGTVTGWRGTAFDHRGRMEELSGAGLVLVLSQADHARLLRLVHLGAPALRALTTDALTEDDAVEIAGLPFEMLALGRCIALHLAHAHVGSSRARRALAGLHHRLVQMGGGTADLSPAAQCAELLLFERSRRRPRPTPAAPDTTHRLSVELEHVAPPVRRSLELSSRATLRDLREALILAFEWSDSHLHVFELGSRRIGVPSGDDWQEVEDERNVSVAAALPRPGDRLTWEYDFGDSWRHLVAVDAIAPEPCPRPRLVSAERAAPPEDCGGPPGYEDLLAALLDPGHEDHERLRAWAGDGFDPEHCDARKLDARLARMATAAARGVGAS